MFLLIYYKWVGYRTGDTSPDPVSNPHGFLKHPSPPPYYNSGSGKTRPIRGGAKRVLTGQMQITIPTRNPEVWSDPLEFLPERFVSKNADVEFSVMGSDLRLAPFGKGRRTCPGKALSLTTLCAFEAFM